MNFQYVKLNLDETFLHALTARRKQEGKEGELEKKKGGKEADNYAKRAVVIREAIKPATPSCESWIPRGLPNYSTCKNLFLPVLARLHRRFPSKILRTKKLRKGNLVFAGRALSRLSLSFSLSLSLFHFSCSSTPDLRTFETLVSYQVNYWLLGYSPMRAAPKCRERKKERKKERERENLQELAERETAYVYVCRRLHNGRRRRIVIRNLPEHSPSNSRYSRSVSSFYTRHPSTPATSQRGTRLERAL